MNSLIITAPDYHDFDYFKTQFEVNNLQYKYEEIGYGYPPLNTKFSKKYPGLIGYVAVFWSGKKDKKIKELIKKTKKHLDNQQE